LNSSTEISSEIVSSVQLWAKETEILSGTSNGIEIHILNAVASDKSLLEFRQYIIQKVSRNRVRKTGV